MRSKTRITGILLASVLAGGTATEAQRAAAATQLKLPPDVLSLACAPTLTYEAPKVELRITGGQDSFVRRIHAPGDLVTVNAGSDNGIKIGQEFYVRRVYMPGQKTINRDQPGTVRTSGWIRIYAVDPKMSLATVTHACDTIEINDYLEPFALPQMPVASTSEAKPEKNYGRVMMGTDRRRSFGKGDYFVLNRGSDQGVKPGSRFVVFRNKHELGVQQPDNFLYELGEAIAVDVRKDASTLQVTLSRDAFTEGDLVAMRPEQ